MGKNATEVFTLLVEVGRAAGDGLPEGAEGAALLCFAAARDEAEAVRETVAVLRSAGLAPLDVTSYGSEAARRSEGHEFGEEETTLIDRARAENAVVVAEVSIHEAET